MASWVDSPEWGTGEPEGFPGQANMDEEPGGEDSALVELERLDAEEALFHGHAALDASADLKDRDEEMDEDPFGHRSFL